MHCFSDNMAQEIERKFLVINDSYKTQGVPHRIRQGYICNEPNCVVRVRCKDGEAFVTIKSANVGFARYEYEYAIPREDAEQMLNRLCQKPIISKTRYCVPYGGFMWEIDCFDNDNEGLVIAEIELPNEHTTFEMPDFIGREVTGDARYYNSNLIAHPYKLWKK